MRRYVVYHFHREHGYGVITLSRDEKRNAISKSMIQQLQQALQDAKEDPLKCLVITGEGDDIFSAGGDLNYFHSDLTTDEAFSRLYKMKEVLYELVSFPMPTVALLNGDAYGGGCEIATACDFRIAKENTKFGFVHTSLGIIPGWGGGVLLYEKVTPQFAYQWLIEAKVYSDTYLREKGWIHQIIPLDEWHEIDIILQPYITKSYEQLKHLKTQYNQKLSVLSLSATMNEEVRQCSLLWGSSFHREKIANFFKK